MKLGMVDFIYNPSTWEAEARGSWVQDSALQDKMSMEFDADSPCFGDIELKKRMNRLQIIVFSTLSPITIY
jgi:hypothetical protein